MVYCKGCKHLWHRQKPLKAGRDIYDAGLVECRKYGWIFEYTSTRALNNLEALHDDCKEVE